MIALCTGSPSYVQKGEMTWLTFPSGEGERVQIALSRNQLCWLFQLGRAAVNESFATPEPEQADIVAMRAKASAHG